MDVAHDLALEGSPTGTLVLAESQTHGRGREGKHWESGPGGIWFTFISRNDSAEAAQVLSIRIGLALRTALQQFTDARLVLKWPNDVFSPEGKVAGVLAETRWRDARPEWTAIGVGINVNLPPDIPGAACIRTTDDRAAVLCAVLSAIRQAAAADAALTRDEVQEYMQFDMLRGRKVLQPAVGVVVGISEDGELVISGEEGIETARSGSVVLAEEQ
jgi:BirA family biotin operon repressor/biotin-[acetyl-CoA-carboxylase] ligase